MERPREPVLEGHLRTTVWGCTIAGSFTSPVTRLQEGVARGTAEPCNASGPPVPNPIFYRHHGFTDRQGGSWFLGMKGGGGLMTRCTQGSGVNGGNTGYPVGKQHEQGRRNPRQWSMGRPVSTAVSGGHGAGSGPFRGLNPRHPAAWRDRIA